MVPHKNKLHELVGYVEQVESVMPDLTVRENLMFSANLRLPKIMSEEKKEEIVHRTLSILGLIEVADCKVGTALKRGISGGEKKRASIGMELVTNPGALILDEPTTGLDAATSYNIMTHLKLLAKSGKTIICSIHQPRYSIFKLCDRLTILTNGGVAFHGKAGDAVGYFESLGYECEQYNNPPDFFLDVVSGGNLFEENEKSPHETVSNASDGTKDFCTLFRSSQFYQDTLAEIDAVRNNLIHGDAGPIVEKPGFSSQCQIVAKRARQVMFRSPTLLMLTLKSNIMLALLVGSIFYQLEVNEDGIENRAGAFFFITMNIVYMNTSTIGHFQTEKPIFVHEKMNRYYSVGAYFLAKVFAYLLPMQIVPTLAFGAISYWMVGFRPGLEYFLKFLMILSVSSVTSASMGFYFGTLVSKTTIGNLLFSLLNTLMLVAAGFLMKLEDMGPWTKWLQHVSIFRYMMEALAVNEFSGNELFVENPSMPSICSEAEAYLLKKGYGGGDAKNAGFRVW
eukprot:CAMPEP_0117745836 /NCGR_PEP_ID=MMETSP0947-20121206/7600_1 /TAXON_ID=44440 /ORGANISM="Chattonella subsalsa, Strain CCMP2191" /LENGTH=508 /DNA_ID=CAMNT_0005563069 /DNA_START=387 /DNA_END=1910 /DNA_ORIENTATION=+